jgi:hypothetical protein
MRRRYSYRDALVGRPNGEPLPQAIKRSLVRAIADGVTCLSLAKHGGVSKHTLYRALRGGNVWPRTRERFERLVTWLDGLNLRHRAMLAERRWSAARRAAGHHRKQRAA